MQATDDNAPAVEWAQPVPPPWREIDVFIRHPSLDMLGKLVQLPSGQYAFATGALIGIDQLGRRAGPEARG